MVHNEDFFLPIWLRHVLRYLEPRDVYIIDHDSTDGSVEQAAEEFGIHISSESHASYGDFEWVTETIKKYFARLVESYSYVLYLDVDEFAVVDPDYFDGDLLRYFENFRGYDWMRLSPRSVMHSPGEPPLDPLRPMLSQRKSWFVDYSFCKPVLANRALDWVPGQHGFPWTQHTERVGADARLLLVHCDRVDYDQLARKREKHHGEPWGGGESYGTYHRLAGKEFRTWFYEPLGRLEEIPERFRGVL